MKTLWCFKLPFRTENEMNISQTMISKFPYLQISVIIIFQRQRIKKVNILYDYYFPSSFAVSICLSLPGYKSIALLQRQKWSRKLHGHWICFLEYKEEKAQGSVQQHKLCSLLNTPPPLSTQKSRYLTRLVIWSNGMISITGSTFIHTVN